MSHYDSILVDLCLIVMFLNGYDGYGIYTLKHINKDLLIIYLKYVEKKSILYIYIYFIYLKLYIKLIKNINV